MQRIQTRINNPETFDETFIASEIAAGKQVILQYSDRRYSAKELDAINSLCRQFGSALEVRFYGHHYEVFDATVLKKLTNVQSLSVDCLDRIENAGALSSLHNLRELSFGVFWWEDPSLLKSLNLSSIEQLSLGQTDGDIIDLSPLQQCGTLKSLRVSGHIKGIEAVGKLPALKELSLRSISKKQSLSFISEIITLQYLHIILGGRQNLDEIRHPKLSKLEIIRVRGLNNLMLGSFPALKRLQIEDQIQMETLRISPENHALETIFLINCKALSSISGLSGATQLQHLRIGQTAINLDHILADGLPHSLKTFTFYTGRQRDDSAIAKQLEALGYTQFDHRR